MSATPDSALANPEHLIADLQRQLAEAREQQTATAEVLQVINSSLGDLAPVFDTMLAKALRLCEAAFGILFIRRGEEFVAGATRGLPRVLDDYVRTPFRPSPDGFFRRAAEGQDVEQFEDVSAPQVLAADDPRRAAYVEHGAARTALNLALRKDGVVLGGFSIFRQEVRPFTDKQIALLQNFAAQAVIAIENARLLGELRQRTADLQESLDYQTAISDVLKVISQSGADLDSVLNMLVETATRICEGINAIIFRLRGDRLHLAASFGVAPEYRDFLTAHPHAINRGTLVGRTATERRVVHILDVTADPEYTFPESQRRGELRTMLGVPLMREETLLGVLALNRKHVEPFTEKQIALVTTFADQALIAIENARLLTELRESLEQQQAIAEILQVINASPGDLAPVFGILLDKAMQLCGAAFGVFWLYDGERVNAAALRGVPPAFEAFLTRASHPVGWDNAHGRLISGEAVVHIADIVDDPAYRSDDPIRRALVKIAGGRTLLAVPLRKDGAFLGDFVIYRTETRPFTEKQIALLQNFAAQAVIAMDNARLLNEIRQRQAELSVTFDNMGDGVAMFDADLRLAAWNANFRRMLDLPDTFLTKRPAYETYIRYLADRGEFGSEGLEAELNRRLENTDKELRFERTRPDGRVIEMRRNSVPGGGFVLMYSDVTERKRAEAEIRTARDAAEKALAELKTAQASLIHAEKMASLGQLTAGIAHEIKNPLNFVNNFAGLSIELLDELKDMAEPGFDVLAPDIRVEVDETIDMLTGNLGKIAEHGRRADGIVQSMLAHSRGSSGERRTVDLNALADEALNLAYHGARAQNQDFDITLERDFAHTMPPVDLVPREMIRVFLNLIGNGFYAAARKNATEEDHPVLKVTTRDLGDMVEVRVRDNGTGIAPEHRDRLFQPFFTTKPTGEGTGLGLSISYDIVTQEHGGTISVDSQVGEFTEFTVRLPRAYGTTIAEAAS